MQITPPDSANRGADKQLQDFTFWLAQTQALTTTRKHKSNLIHRLDHWELALRNAYAIFKSVPVKDTPSSRAREWVLDNYYVVKQTFRQIEEDLPDDFLSQLPVLDSGLPRIFALAREWIGFNQSQLTIPQFESFVRDYQHVTSLTIGELWALPIMLRIGVLERLVYATAELTGIDLPEGWVEIPIQTLIDCPTETIVSNSFISLRLLAATDWLNFFEQTSRVEQILREDPALVYASMNFKTRNSYRSVVEELARHSMLNEEQVAFAAVELARDVPDDKAAGRQGHVGYYLWDRGRAQLEAKIRYKPELRSLLHRRLLAAPTSAYLGSIATLSTLLVSGLLAYTHLAGGSLAQMIVVGLLGFGLALESAITIVHWQVTHRIKPQSLPRMDFSESIPPGNRTMVVVPTLLDNEAELNHLLKDLELYYLSNPDPQLTYALLTDFGDAPAQNMPEDDDLLALASAGVANLNKKHAPMRPFYLFHRNRQWNPSEGVWMGWERKRGKLADFNRLLLNLGETAYTTQVGDVGILTSIKYVITLDSDTSLPQGSANRLVATLAHPLNQAEFSADGRSVSAGYTVLQPRVAIKPTSANRSRFSQIFAGNAGFDLYSFAVSDVYQDLFGEGSYIGKGIYDVAAFERSLAGQVRQNTLLSHDLFEGIYGRTALVTDVMLYEEYPSRYLTYARRLRRWVRGDWQLLPWLFPIVRTKTGLSPNRLSTIDLWKVFDNLRRSLLPPTLLALLVAGWLFLPGSPLVWTLLVVLPAALPILMQTVQDGKHNTRRLTLKQVLRPIQLPLTRWVLAVVFLSYEALLMLNAISTTLGRLLITHNRFLQWTTAANTSRAESTNPQNELWREMKTSLIFTVLLGISISIFNPGALRVAAPLLAAWLIAPQVAIIISRPVKHTRKPLTEPQRRKVQRLARRTWAFFEKFVGPNDHWLPPDHFQESPRGSVAHYTTPTNIGLFLVSTLSAYDLGYMGLSELALRLRSTLESMEKLEHYRGHLLNWYDSQSMTVLQPRYVSTVDSGNLAASLITLKQGCLSMPDAPLLGSRQWQGLLVLLDILSDALQSLEKDNPEADTESFEVELTSIYQRVSAALDQPEAWTMTLAWLSGQGWERVSRRLMELLESHPNLQRESLTELQLYLDLLHHQLQDMQRSLNLFSPWLGDQELNFLRTPAEREFSASLDLAASSPGDQELNFLHTPAGREYSASLDLAASSPGDQELHFLHTPAGREFSASPDLAASSPGDQELHFLHTPAGREFSASLDLAASSPGDQELHFLHTPAGREFSASLPVEMPKLGEAEAVYQHIQNAVAHFKSQVQDEAAVAWCQKMDADLSSASGAVAGLLVDFRELADQADAAINAMDFRFLYSQRRQVFHIGYNVSTEQLDPSYYDLLASEARIASLIAIAKGDVPQGHWQHLGRPVTNVNGKPILLSWSGTMFEYLMPSLFIKNYPGTFLSESCDAALEVQAGYGDELKVPWGISESGYYAFDLNLNYQYRAFGVPGLGYKRDLPEDLVITPYASLLGLSLQPQAVLKNMARFEELNMLGRFGFFEAIDYTGARLPEKHRDDPAGRAHAIVQSYMAHHQGMILMAACNFLLDDVMVARFHANEHIQSVELLLQEKVPLNPPLEFPHTDEPTDLPDGAHTTTTTPWRVPVNSPSPQAHILAQGDASLLITNSGAGYSQWRGLALTRWQADTTLDHWGSWIYIQDCENGALWSATCQPLGLEAEQQEVLFYPHKVEFPCTENGITMRTDITISPEGVEMRRVNIFNDSDRPRQLKLTSYGEVVLAAQIADRRHPAFNKLFIESEYLPGENALIFQRRPRSADEEPVVLVHAMVIEAGRKISGEYESDRARFLGRLNTVRNPLALKDPGQPLSGSAGGTLDPVFSLAQKIDLKPHAKTRVTFLTLAAPTRAEALEKLSHCQTGQSIHRAFKDARANSERELLGLGLNSSALEYIQSLLSALLYPVGALRPAPHLLAENKKGQSGLWAFGISGDYPLLLVHIRDGESPLLTEAIKAFKYWRSRHITVNLVILNDEDTGYALDLHNAILRQIRSQGAESALNQRDGIFVLRADQIQPAENTLLQTVAGVVLDESRGTLAEHALRLSIQPTRLPPFSASLGAKRDSRATDPLQIPGGLLMDNGLGGFSRDGREYIIHLQPGQHTPHPWINVIANPKFGFLVSESGSGCTWAENSGENRLTPWRNDPLTDMPGEALYLRDEETGLIWSPTPMPAGEETTHVIRHGAGYSSFESQSHGLNQNLCYFSAPDAPVKIIRLRLKNLWQRSRRITVTYYAEWVLGATRDLQQAHIMPEFIPEKHALLATNRFNSDFGERVAFLAASKRPHGVTTDRTEFLGRMGSLRAPAALGRIGLDSAVNAGLDPCAVIQLHVDLAPGAEEEIFFLLGEGADRLESLALIEEIQAEGQVEAVWQSVQRQWDDILNAVTVETPDAGMNLMLNRWLLYQTISCRLWGRTGLYQSSGAFGFRDQLQDVMALLHTRPAIARAQILEAARHQFDAGDVLHWWNPPSGRGVRTRFSDDLLWLPFVTAEYVEATGDDSILHEKIPFLVGEALKPDEMERYTQFQSTPELFSLYEHCRRALEKGATSGVHGLPLMGGGDWNDGMNRVGMNGRGESIWLGWFLYAGLQNFAQLARLMTDDPAPYLEQARQLAQSLETHAWDGDWYLRAFYDDGSQLGSRESMECKIDSIAQSWAVLSGAADPVRAGRAMESVNRLLVKPRDGMVLLFTPPFDKTTRDPGYIKGYLPGVRENGGQYTHAAAWTVWAFARLGQGERAVELFHMLNPISHADTPEKIATYKVEPYVIAADVYSMPPLTGQGGWTWYTGSSGWMYRLGSEAILGLNRVGSSLRINPCIPKEWPGFKVDYRFGSSKYKIRVENPGTVNRGVKQVLLDGNPVADSLVPLVDDGQSHDVDVVLG